MNKFVSYFDKNKIASPHIIVSTMILIFPSIPSVLWKMVFKISSISPIKANITEINKEKTIYSFKFENKRVEIKIPKQQANPPKVGIFFLLLKCWKDVNLIGWKNLCFLKVFIKNFNTKNVIKNEKYLDLFLNLFNEMSKIEYELDDFLLYLENIDTYNLKITLSSSGSSLDSVTIMNVHKSKGLEYKIIYFTGLHANINLKDTEKSFNVSSKFGVILPPEDSNKTNLLKIVEQDKETKDSISEAIRLFYVALTRTKEKMICVLGHKSYDKLIEELNNEKINTFINNNDLDNKPLTEQFHIIVEAYLNKKINQYILEELFERYYLPLPKDLTAPTYETFYEPFKELLDEINYFNSNNISFDDFIKGLEEKDFDEDRLLIPSTKVATYDLQPEMSAYELTDKLLSKIDSTSLILIIESWKLL